MTPDLTPIQRRSQASRKAARVRKVMALSLPHRLSRQQVRVLNLITDAIEQTGHSPSTREILDALGLSSISHMNRIIGHLVEQGYLLRRVIPSYTELTIAPPLAVDGLLSVGA